MHRTTMTPVFPGLALAALLFSPGPAELDAQAPADFVEPGTRAPDVTLVGATRWGPLGAPVQLSDLRGKTVVLAFFPAARTRGCTIQMQTYRDEYARVFNGGRDVVLVAISNDPVQDLVSWASDEDFPFLFASDADGSVYRAFGGTPSDSGRLGRTLVVIDPQGTVAELLPRFMEIDPTAYDELQAVVARVTPSEVGQR